MNTLDVYARISRSSKWKPGQVLRMAKRAAFRLCNIALSGLEVVRERAAILTAAFQPENPTPRFQLCPSRNVHCKQHKADDTNISV